MKNTLILALCTLSALPLSLSAKGLPADIQTIFETACVRCHGADKDKGEFRMHTREALLKGGESGVAIKPGAPDTGTFVKLISLSEEDENAMPAKGAHLTPQEIATIRAWIENGAPWPQDLVLEKKERRVTDDIEVVAASATQVDKMLEIDNAKKEGEMITGPGLSDLAFARKTTVDLIGRIPTYEEVIEYSRWPKAERREKLVDQLLQHERFAERWTVFFADMLRIRSNATGGNQLLAYVNRALRDGKPYDEMCYELVAANGKPGMSPEVGFVLGDNADPMALAGATSQIFLGVRLQCAQCHDHPFDEWKQKEFYEFAAFFGKTKRVESRFTRSVYTTEGKEMKIQWPPEGKEKEGEDRKAMKPRFPFVLENYDRLPPHIARLNELRAKARKETLAKNSGPDIDALLDGADGTVPDKRMTGPAGFDVLGDARKDINKIDVKADLYKESQLRKQLARMVTDPRNRFFSQALINRVWADLMGRGFFTPLDDFADESDVSHPNAMKYLSDEFVASGYDLRSVLKLIVLTRAYQTGHVQAADFKTQDRSEKAFTAATPRRMLSEVLYDSVVQAGHLFDHKWPAGANIKTVERQERVYLDVPEEERKPVPVAATPAPSSAPAMMTGDPTAMQMQKQTKRGYDLEKSIEVDFDKALSGDQIGDELAMMKMKSDEQLEVERLAKMKAEQERQRRRRYKYVTVEETIDDNPKFNTAMRMQTPAAPAHFMRVFGQPSRASLGEFREHTPSLRQALMMLNGRITHEAARVGQFEELYPMLEGDKANPEKAIKYAYLETLTRLPSPEEISEGLQVLTGAENKLLGMADLRWALLNCHEFRYLP